MCHLDKCARQCASFPKTVASPSHSLMLINSPNAFGIWSPYSAHSYLLMWLWLGWQPSERRKKKRRNKVSRERQRGGLDWKRLWRQMSVKSHSADRKDVPIGNRKNSSGPLSCHHTHILDVCSRLIHLKLTCIRTTLMILDIFGQQRREHQGTGTCVAALVFAHDSIFPPSSAILLAFVPTHTPHW